MCKIQDMTGIFSWVYMKISPWAWNEPRMSYKLKTYSKNRRSRYLNLNVIRFVEKLKCNLANLKLSKKSKNRNHFTLLEHVGNLILIELYVYCNYLQITMFEYLSWKLSQEILRVNAHVEIPKLFHEEVLYYAIKRHDDIKIWCPFSNMRLKSRMGTCC